MAPEDPHDVPSGIDLRDPAVAGLLLVCDHVPYDQSARATSLHSTGEEQHATFASAGFVEVATVLLLEGLYLCRGHRPG